MKKNKNCWLSDELTLREKRFRTRKMKRHKPSSRENLQDKQGKRQLKQFNYLRSLSEGEDGKSLWHVWRCWPNECCTISEMLKFCNFHSTATTTIMNVQKVLKAGRDGCWSRENGQGKRFKNFKILISLNEKKCSQIFF